MTRYLSGATVFPGPLSSNTLVASSGTYAPAWSHINPRNIRFNADATGTDDSTASLQSAANVLAGAGGGDYILDGNYRITSTLTFGGNTRVRGVGRARIHCSTTSNGISVSGGSVYFDNVRLTGSATTATTNVIGLALADNCIVRNSEFSGWNIGVQSQGSRCLIDGNTFHESLGSTSGQGYAVLALAPETRVANNAMLQTGRHGVYFSGSTLFGGATRSVAVGNIIEMGVVAGGGSAIKTYATSSQSALVGVAITGNTIRHTTPGTVALGIEFLDDVTDSVACGNTIIDTTSRALTVNVDGSASSDRPARCVFVGNTVSTNSGFFIHVNVSSGNIPAGNVFANNVTNRNSTTAISDSGNSTHIVGNAPYPDSLPLITLGSGDATPSVYNTRLLRTANGSVTTITFFDDGRTNQEILLRVADANTRIASGASMRLKADANISAVSGDVYRFILGGTVWYETSRNTA